jgi:hypothetical protein
MMLAAKGSLHMLAGSPRVKARVQHPQVKPRKDRLGWPWVFRYWFDEVQADGSVKTLRKYQAIGGRARSVSCEAECPHCGDCC